MIDRAPDRVELPVDHLALHRPGPRRVPRVDHVRRQIEDDRDDRYARGLGALDQRSPSGDTRVGRVDDGQPATSETPLHGPMQDPERDARGALVGLVTGDRGAQGVR